MRPLQIRMVEGDLCAAEADVICVSTNPGLELMAGTGGAVREAGGWGIQDECNRVIAAEAQRSGKRCLTLGSVVRVGAGTLPFRAILMCVAADPFHLSSSETIAMCTRNALEVTQRDVPEAASIAMPVFAAGHSQFHFDWALEAMLGVLSAAAPGRVTRCDLVTINPLQYQRAMRHSLLRAGGS